MKRICIAIGLSLAGIHSAAAIGLNDWPTQGKTESGVEYGLKAQFQYDLNEFGNDRLDNGTQRFEDAHDWRRREFGGFVRKPGVFELLLGYDFASDTWIDNYFKFNAGKAHEIRLGQMKTPVGLDEGATSSAATTFLERAAPANAIYEGRRIGADWTWTVDKHWRVNLGYFSGGDLNGFNEGHTAAGRVVFTPRNEEGDVLHFGLAASREQRDDDTARVRTRPEAGLTDVRLVDSGALAGADDIDRLGLEGAWQRGPWVAQAEWLTANVRREGTADYRAQGAYAQASWMLTGETKPYKGSAFGNPKPARAAGAVELGLRYSTLDLDDGLVAGGTQHDWTLGASWYLTRYFKFQANYVRVDSDRRAVTLSPDVFEMRVQLSF
ncbi:OprO/OprP family phosphate-selective porin [Lysobacter terrae]